MEKDLPLNYDQTCLKRPSKGAEYSLVCAAPQKGHPVNKDKCTRNLQWFISTNHPLNKLTVKKFSFLGWPWFTGLTVFIFFTKIQKYGRHYKQNNLWNLYVFSIYVLQECNSLQIHSIYQLNVYFSLVYSQKGFVTGTTHNVHVTTKKWQVNDLLLLCI